jgi:hypothetical protein
MPRVKDLKRESFSFGPFFRTNAGTTLYSGIHQVLDPKAGTFHHDMSLRDYTLLYGRREKDASAFDVIEWPPGTFMGEQFLEGGLQLPSGRLIFTMWGIAVRGENWRCGVLISDDDGKSWRFNTVGYEPDLSIRNRPEQPAGFNEQTLFYTPEGRLVSIIRGREGLGRGVPGGGNADTWFFRSESSDDGETWTTPEPTDLPGTGATNAPGLTLPDGSLLIGSRIPYSRTYYDLPEKDLFGLNLARSFDRGRTWVPECFIQRDHEGHAFNRHHCAMNGRFYQTGINEQNGERIPCSAAARPTTPRSVLRGLASALQQIKLLTVEDTLQLAAGSLQYDYIFGFFGHACEPKLQRVLKLRLRIE